MLLWIIPPPLSRYKFAKIFSPKASSTTFHLQSEKLIVFTDKIRSPSRIRGTAPWLPMTSTPGNTNQKPQQTKVTYGSVSSLVCNAAGVIL